MQDLAEQTKPSADAVLARSEAEAHDVHAYALKEIGVIEFMLDQLKLNIQAKKAAREVATREYIEAVDEAIRASRAMEPVVAKLAEAVGKV